MTKEKKTGWFSALFQAQDMTVGSPAKCFAKFSIPLLMGNIVQMLYNTVDSIVVGKYCGDAALSAIGLSGPMSNLFLVFFMAIGAGVMVMVSQYFGAKEMQNLSNTIGNAISLILIMSVVIMAVATPLTPAMLRVLNTPEESFDLAKAYLVIIFLGAAGNGLYNILSGVLRGMGEALFPFLVLTGCSLLNVVLDIWFVAGLKMGTAGAALATILAQFLSAAVCLIKVLSLKGEVKITRSTLKLKKRIVFMIIKLGVPSGVSMGIMFASTLLVQSLINKMGYLVMAAVTATSRVDSFALLPSQTFGMSASTFTGQNVGAGRLDRVKKGEKTVLLMCLGFTAVMVVFMELCGKSLIGLFTDTESVKQTGVGFIRIMIPGYIIMVISQCLSGIMRGAGDVIGPMWIAIINNVGLRVPASYIIAYFTRSEEYPNGAPNSIFLGVLVAVCLSSIITTIYYRKGKWKTKSIIEQKETV